MGGEKIADLDKRLSIVEAYYQSEKERVDQIEHRYFGNGKMGDRTKIAILWWFYPTATGIIGAAVGSVLTQIFMRI